MPPTFAARLYGAAITQAGALAVVAFAVAADQPVHSAGAALEFGLIFAGGCLWALLLSLTGFDIYAVAALGYLLFVGAQNYERLLTNPLFWGAMRNTVWFSVLGVPLSIGVSLVMAFFAYAVFFHA